MKYLFVPTILALSACTAETQTVSVEQSAPTTVLQASANDAVETAIFAGGCFWCVEKDFEAVPGVIEAVSGYTGGQTIEPTYKQVSYSDTGHYEAVQVSYDPGQVSYEELVDFFWTTVDPTDPKGQFCDKGDSYRTAVFATPEQIVIAKESLEDVKANKPFSDPIVTPVLKAQEFWDAEDYHQNYYKTSSLKYNYYRRGCGRDARVKQLWGHKADWAAFKAGITN